MPEFTVVVSAFACHPHMSSEPGIGWVFVRETARIARGRNLKVLAIMNGRSAEATREALAALGYSHVRVEEIDAPRAIRKPRSPNMTRVEYLLWCQAARRRLTSLANSADIVLAHHVTFASEILPTPIGALDQRTLRVWGPIGSSGAWRAYFIKPRERTWLWDAVLQGARDRVASALARAFARSVDIVIGVTDEVAATLRGVQRTVMVFPNVIVPLELAQDSTSTHGERPENDRLLLLAAGHLIPRKRFALAIAALAEPTLRDARLVIAGAPWRVPDYLPAVARRYGVADRVEFLGKIPRAELIERMRQSDVFVHLAAREGSNGTVGEATSIGVPVVCFAGTGSAAVVRAAEASGIVLDPSTATTREIAEGIDRAARLPRRPYAGWTETRISELIDRLIATALARRHARASA